MDKSRRFSRSVHYFDEPEVVEEIKQRAYEHGHSMAAEIRRAVRGSLEEPSCRPPNGLGLLGSDVRSIAMPVINSLLPLQQDPAPP